MMSKPSYAKPDAGPDEGIAENQCRHCQRFYPDSLADQDGLCASCVRMTGTLNPRPGDLPQCRECGRPSPNGDPCEDCAEVERILSMTDEEVIASSSPEDVAWSEGVVAGIKIGRMLGEMRAARRRSSDAGWRTIETAPHCVPSGVEFPNDNGRRPVLVTRWPISGFHHPVAVARLTANGWICGKRGSRLWFVPTHWMPTPGPPRDSGSRRDGEDPRSGAEAEGRQNGSRSEIARDLPA